MRASPGSFWTARTRLFKGLNMQATYKMIGADGAEYGPVDLRAFRAWITEGRVSGATHVMRSDQESWSTAASFPELGVRDAIGTAGASPGEAVLDPAETSDLDTRIKSGASWFYWIGALTLINSVVAFSGSEWGFYLGFTVLQALDFAVQETHIAIRGAVLAFDLFVAVGFAALGFFAAKRQVWPFAVGVVLYGLDSLLTLGAVFFGGSILGAALHTWAIVSLILGISSVIKLKKLQRESIG